LDDLDDRFWGGTATGELFKTLFALANSSSPDLASWNNAIKIAELVATRPRRRGSRTDLSNAKRRFRSVAHLWSAWSIREGEFSERPELGYDGYDDFQFFLTEAEILCEWGQTWQPRRATSSPFLPSDVWRPSENWLPPMRQAGWPRTGVIPQLRLPADLLAQLRPSGRPRRQFTP
jgi:hypothetical protein